MKCHPVSQILRVGNLVQPGLRALPLALSSYGCAFKHSAQLPHSGTFATTDSTRCDYYKRTTGNILCSVLNVYEQQRKVHLKEICFRLTPSTRCRRAVRRCVCPRRVSFCCRRNPDWRKRTLTEQGLPWKWWLFDRRLEKTRYGMVETGPSQECNAT